jgi:hypothetical protein
MTRPKMISAGFSSTQRFSRTSLDCCIDRERGSQEKYQRGSHGQQTPTIVPISAQPGQIVLA